MDKDQFQSIVKRLSDLDSQLNTLVKVSDKPKKDGQDTDFIKDCFW